MIPFSKKKQETNDGKAKITLREPGLMTRVLPPFFYLLCILLQIWAYDAAGRGMAGQAGRAWLLVFAATSISC
jgi:hypothetical protein